LSAPPAGDPFVAAAYALLALTSMHLLAPRRGRLHPTVVKDVGWVLQRMALPLLVLVPFVVDAPRTLATMVPVAIACVLAGRVAGSSILRRARVRGAAWDPCLIVGTGELGQALARVLLSHPEYGLRPSGFVGDSDPEGSALPLLGKFDDLPFVAGERGVTKVVIADPARSDAAIARMLTKESAGALELFVVPRLPNVGATIYTSMKNEVRSMAKRYVISCHII
jgi:FlaA1/EpsC-like NDP-sugar epimerase